MADVPLKVQPDPARAAFGEVGASIDLAALIGPPPAPGPDPLLAASGAALAASDTARAGGKSAASAGQAGAGSTGISNVGAIVGKEGSNAAALSNPPTITI